MINTDGYIEEKDLAKLYERYVDNNYDEHNDGDGLDFDDTNNVEEQGDEDILAGYDINHE